MRPLLAVVLATALTVALGGCSVLGGDDGYRLVAYFTKAPSLYEESRVKIMGANVGTVTDLRIEGRQIRVTLAIDPGIPVPADARASIGAESVIGERGVILYPAWRPGGAKAAAGAVIPVTRTDPPVEVDEVLDSFTKLSDSLDPAKVGGLLDTGAGLLKGRGKGLNEALATSAELAESLAAQDRQIVSAAGGLRDLVTQLNKHDQGLRGLIDAFQTTSAQLADERTRLRNLLMGLAALIHKGGVVVTAYRETLPDMVTKASSLVMTLKANSASMGEAMRSLARFTDVVVNAWDRKTNTIVARLQLNATLRIWLQPVFDLMGWGRVPCLDQPLGNCQRTIVRKGRP